MAAAVAPGVGASPSATSPPARCPRAGLRGPRGWGRAVGVGAAARPGRGLPMTPRRVRVVSCRPKRQPKPSSEEGYWDCSVCTFRNSAEAFKCMMCDVRKGTSTRHQVPDANMMPTRLSWKTTPPVCPGAPFPQNPAPLGKERGRLGVWIDLSIPMFIREAITEAKTVHLLHPTMTLGPYSQSVKEQESSQGRGWDTEF
ncbi:YY1-associated factor 2 isoform X4 [Erinaceus europaeus]|uniref:YY1-associated factor 2 isoform X4 n=1 Tax=Erinaceus europaeus TaxID=9365 RepID=A0ABM3XFD7_ERIEU|nr:YY1-associated factor 2 isoform X4 [Erinaceus europaeus]